MENKIEIADGVVIRPIVPADKPLMEEFFKAMGGESRAMFDRSGYNSRTMLKYCDEPIPTQRFWMAEYEGKAAGYVFFYNYGSMIPELGIAVRDDLKGLHLGSRLMDYAIDHAKGAGKGGIRLTTLTANVRGQVLYERKGFKRLGLYTNLIELFYLLSFEDKNVTAEQSTAK